MGSTNPLEILENRILDEKKVEDKEKEEKGELDPFMSDDESFESSDSEDKKRKKKVINKSSKIKTDEFGRKIRSTSKYGSENKKIKLKSDKKHELYKKRKLEYEKDFKEREEGKESVLKYQLSAIDRMTMRREQLLKKHSTNFINDIRKSKDK
ncbi:conserved hypothetical protein [Theileria orientalis strain Shintoku]|uniref:Uncharacterized protein n=1 Tax=Theileria orientalis strain Shintoku TaxID=869250 RepID=J7M8C7_THEOR|nr:conserved hypothetical protein [Theileria orientalis strain Shintoku]PVC54217.1 hypothetical protein MACL_00003182 [Theileria orientalis]BAM38718.1 conserved hypothetical protein [Theileria orientalis strain Shintoku]|eukprot:XP_009689019.1 conserved hypothetical protein [Theileria orientalis strain Shintoku]